jgi:subtilisin-like proprotein convertase family protein
MFVVSCRVVLYLCLVSSQHICIGVAPEVTLSSCIVFDRSADFLAAKLDSMDISQNSYGASACSWKDTRYRERRRILREQLLQKQQQQQHPKGHVVESTQESSSTTNVQFDDSHPHHRNTQSSSSSSCPFTYANRFNTLPCNTCNNNFVAPLSSDCEAAIVRHCKNFYEYDASGCLEFLDLFLQDGTCEYNSLGAKERALLQQGIQQGRNGLGIIYIFAAGNDYSAGADTNMEGYLNTRFTISVGAVGKDGLHASYGTPGTALFVVAPGGDKESVTDFVTAQASGGCYNAGEGTSFSAPVVSGVVALILQANPNLSWRDVQGILAATSQMVVTDDADDTLVTNAAGYHHSNFYGFGIVNANNAVTAARSWIPFESEQMLVGESGVLNLQIVDDPSTPAVSTVDLSASDGAEFETELRQQSSSTEGLLFGTESVVVYLDVRHVSRGDLDIILTSPEGTVSTLLQGKRPETTQLDEDERWKLLTLKSWGESPFGTWTLKISDENAGQVGACVDAPWQIYDMGLEIDCQYFITYEYCVDGTLDAADMQANGEAYILDIVDDDEGITASQACCACGGGRTGSNFVNQLVQWRLVVYGHYYSIENTVPVTALPDATTPSSPVGPPTAPTPTLAAGPAFFIPTTLGGGEPNIQPLPTDSYGGGGSAVMVASSASAKLGGGDTIRISLVGLNWSSVLCLFVWYFSATS